MPLPPTFIPETIPTEGIIDSSPKDSNAKTLPSLELEGDPSWRERENADTLWTKSECRETRHDLRN